MFKFPFFNSRKGEDSRPVLSDGRALHVQAEAAELSHAASAGDMYTCPGAAAGYVLPIYSNTAQIFGIWNPAGSGVIVDVYEWAMTYVSTTGAAGGYVLGIVKNAGAAIATGGNVSVFTDLDIFSAMGTGHDVNPKARVCSAATVTAPVIWRHLGLNQLVTTAADATTVPWTARAPFRGDCQVAPNTAVFLAGNIATLTIWAPSVTWKEKSVA